MKALTLLHKECKECLLGPVGLSSLSVFQLASRSPFHHGHLWANGSHIQESGQTKAQKVGKGVENWKFLDDHKVKYHLFLNANTLLGFIFFRKSFVPCYLWAFTIFNSDLCWSTFARA